MPKLGLNARKNWRVRGCNEIEIGVEVLRSNNSHSKPKQVDFN
jgi:hypothetical protein